MVQWKLSDVKHIAVFETAKVKAKEVNLRRMTHIVFDIQFALKNSQNVFYANNGLKIGVILIKLCKYKKICF